MTTVKSIPDVDEIAGLLFTIHAQMKDGYGDMQYCLLLDNDGTLDWDQFIGSSPMIGSDGWPKVLKTWSRQRDLYGDGEEGEEEFHDTIIREAEAIRNGLASARESNRIEA